MTLGDLLRAALPEAGTVILRNAQGTTELRGEDLGVKESAGWVTVHHGAPGESEGRSHMHLRRGACRYARVRDREGMTSCLEFWPDEGAARAAGADGKPPLALVFRSFYDWENGKSPIPGNRRRFDAWVARHGREFPLQDDAPAAGAGEYDD